MSTEIDGLKKAARERVDLSEFFDDGKHSVEITVLDPATRAKVKELTMSNYEIAGTGDPRGKDGGAYTSKMLSEGFADRLIQVRSIKLKGAVTDHDFTVDGKKVEFDDALIEAIDSMNADVLDKVIAAIDKLSPMVEKGNPT